MLPRNKVTSLYQNVDLKRHHLHNYTNGQYILENLHKYLWNNVFVFQMPWKISLIYIRHCAFFDPQQKFEQFVKNAMQNTSARQTPNHGSASVCEELDFETADFQPEYLFCNSLHYDTCKNFIVARSNRLNKNLP